MHQLIISHDAGGTKAKHDMKDDKPQARTVF